MHGLFGFDPKSMSDEELLERWHTLNRRIVWVGRFGSMELLNQLQNIKQTIEFEQRERIIEVRLRARAAMPTVVVESDPDLAEEHRAAQEAETEKTSKKPARPNVMTRERIRATNRPSTGGEE